MAKYEADVELLNRLKASIKEAIETNDQTRNGIASYVILREGEHFQKMSIIYASLLAEHIEQQLAADNIVDVQLFSLREWEDMEARLLEELE